MAEELVITDRRSAAIERAPEPNSSLLGVMQQLALNPNIDADKIEKLFNVFVDGQRKMQEMADEKAFADGMAEFKKNPPEIIKNRKAKVQGTAKGSGREYSYEYSYADLDAYCKAAMPQLAQHGITWSFPFSEDQTGKITVSCVLRYGLYKHTPTTLSGMPEGGNNPLQAKGVAVAYMERYTFCGATGLTAAMPDNDNNASIMDELVKSWEEKLDKASDTAELNRISLEAIKAVRGDTNAVQQIGQAKNKRIKEIKEGAK